MKSEEENSAHQSAEGRHVEIAANIGGVGAVDLLDEGIILVAPARRHHRPDNIPHAATCKAHVNTDRDQESDASNQADQALSSGDGMAGNGPPKLRREAGNLIRQRLRIDLDAVVLEPDRAALGMG